MDNTDDKIKIYTAFTNIILKVVVAISILVAFFIILSKLIGDQPWQDKTIYGIVDSILGYTMYPLTKHFFPALSETIKAEKSN